MISHLYQDLLRVIRSREDRTRIMRQFVKFGFVGFFNTLLSLAIYYSMVSVGVHILIANAVAFILSVLNSYYWNNKYVFSKTTRGHVKALLRTYAAYSFTFILSTVLLYVMVNNLGISKYLAPLINLCFTIPVNFLINKLWAFK